MAGLELLNYRNALLQQVKVNSSANMNYQKLEFLKLTTNILSDAEEFTNFVECNYEGVAKRNKKFQIDGYAFDESDMTLYLITCIYEGFSTPTTINETIAAKYFERAGTFIDEIDYIVENGEESAAGYELALDISSKISSKYIRKIKFYLISDGISSERIKILKSKTINGIDIEYHLWDISRFYKLEKSSSGKEDIERKG